MVCARCKTPYCSRECQAQDWKFGDHKTLCAAKMKQIQSTGAQVNKDNASLAMSAFNRLIPQVVPKVMSAGKDPTKVYYELDVSSVDRNPTLKWITKEKF